MRTRLYGLELVLTIASCRLAAWTGWKSIAIGASILQYVCAGALAPGERRTDWYPMLRF